MESAEGGSVLGWRPAVGQVVPKTEWTLEEKLGEGGFGEVWKAWHGKLHERRVFKFCFRADWIRALKREVTLFRLLKEQVGEHPNIVKLRAGWSRSANSRSSSCRIQGWTSTDTPP